MSFFADWRRLRLSRLTAYHGLNAVVTGASSGIGRLLALRFAAHGARVALVARRADALEAVAAEIRARGGDALVLPVDISDPAAVQDAARVALDRFGTVDILVNNAGYGHRRAFLDWDLEDMERVMRVNYFGTLYWTKTLLPYMVERRRGWLVFIASVAGKIGVPEESAYAATKFAMVGLAESLSVEVEDAGVHVLTVCPGVIRTSFFDEEALARMPPVARRGMVDPEPLVDAIVRALAVGRRELTFPRPIAAAYVAKAFAPGFVRRNLKRTTLDSLRKRR
ncbi:MAG: SDR family oxidoreductase [Candidatus Binatia bacterium]